MAADIGLADALALQSMYIFKQPLIGGEVGCHQDATFLYTDPMTRHRVLVRHRGRHARERLPVGRARAATARPLRKLFKRAGADRRRRHRVRGARRRRRCPTPPDELVPLEVPAGTLVVLHGLLPHWSDVNRSPTQPPRLLAALHLGRRRLPGVELAAAPGRHAAAGARPTRRRRSARSTTSSAALPEGAAARPPRRRAAAGDGDRAGRRSTATTACRPPTSTSWPTWFNRGAKRNDLVLYLETFAHTVGVMQHRDAIERVACECAEDLAADGVVYAEVRFAPELCTEAGPHARRGGRGVLDGFRPRLGRHRPHDLRHLLGHAHRGAQPGDRRAGRALARRRRGRLRHRRRRGRLPADPPPRRVPVRAARELPHHDPRRRGVRPAVDLGGACSGAAPSASATACASSTTSPGRPATSSSAGWPRTSATGASRSSCARRRTSTPASCASIAEHPIGMLRRLRFRVTVNTDNRLMSDTSMIDGDGAAARRVRLGPRRLRVAHDQRHEERVRPVPRAAAHHQRARSSRATRCSAPSRRSARLTTPRAAGAGAPSI